MAQTSTNLTQPPLPTTEREMFIKPFENLSFDGVAISHQKLLDVQDFEKWFRLYVDDFKLWKNHTWSNYMDFLTPAQVHRFERALRAGSEKCVLPTTNFNVHVMDSVVRSDVYLKIIFVSLFLSSQTEILGFELYILP